MRLLRLLWPLLLLLLVLAGLWASGLGSEVSWTGLARNQARFTAWVAARPIAAAVTYIAAYALAVAVCLPESAVITVAGGLLFGTVAGGLLAIVGSTAGAVVLFLAARHHLADTRAANAGTFFDGIRRRLARDGFNYLLALRLIPAFPFWLVNLAAALCGMRLWPYFAATLIGIIPATFVFTSIGAGIGDVLAMGGAPDLSVIFSVRVLGPLAALAALSLLPLVWRRERPDA
jgi:uncharacterized membrane protein YdjX (TVP38/TMEM64 family)